MENYGNYMQVLNLIKLFHTRTGNKTRKIKQSSENLGHDYGRYILIIDFFTLSQNANHALILDRL